VEEFELAPRRAMDAQVEHLTVQPADSERSRERPQRVTIDAAVGVPGVGERDPPIHLRRHVLLGFGDGEGQADEMASDRSGLVFEKRQHHVPDLIPKPPRV
jgi:hypothetical protein